MKIAMTGATGFIGNRLVKELREDGHNLLILGRRPVEGLPFSRWDASGGPPPGGSFEGAGAVVHLAGEPVARRWNSEIKRRIRESRVAGTRRLVEALSALRDRPQVLVCASAIGYYGDRGGEELNENSAAGDGFLAGVCREWEDAAAFAEPLGIRVVRLRIGIVLGREGGALRQMLPAFRVGLGGKLASGRQWMSWIHVEDLTGLIRHALSQPALSGPVNGTAPNPVTNEEFTQVLAATIHRPAVFAVPALTLRLLYGEMASVLLASQRVLPEAALAGGYRFQYPELGPALAAILRA